MGVPLTGSWDGPSQTLTIISGDAAQQQQTADGEAAQATSLTQTSAAAGGLGADSSRVMSSRTQPGAAGPSSSTDDEGLPPEMLLNSMKFKLKDWLESVAGRVSNPSHIPYAELPLQVSISVPGRHCGQYAYTQQGSPLCSASDRRTSRLL